MKTNLKRVLSIFLCIMLIFGLLSSSMPSLDLHAEEILEYTVSAYGGTISYADNSETFTGTAILNSVLNISFNETEFEGLTFEYWKADTGEIIPKNSFELLVDQNIYFFPVFKDIDVEFGPWTLLLEGTSCTKGDIYTREDKINGIKEYKRVYNQYGHDFSEYESIDEDNHFAICSLCGEKLIQPHYWDITTTEATCISEGIKTYTCNDCGAIKTEIIPINEHAHKMGEWEILEEAKDGNIGRRKRVCEYCGAAEEADYIKAQWEKLYKNHYIDYVSYDSGMATALDRNERHYSYVNSDGNDAYIYSINMGDKDAGLTYALMYIDDPTLTAKPVYMAKSFSTSYESFDWSLYTYVYSFEEYIESTLRMENLTRASSLIFIAEKWADYFNERNGQLPSNCSYDGDIEYKGFDCKVYTVLTSSDPNGPRNVYYVTKDSNVTVYFSSRNISNKEFEIRAYKEIKSDIEYDGLDEETQNLYLKKSDIPESIKELNTKDSRYDLNVTEDKPTKLHRYSLGVYSYNTDRYSYDYYISQSNMKNYYYGMLYIHPDDPTQSPNGIAQTFYKVTFRAADWEDHEFDYWELLNWETREWEFLSNEENYEYNYVELNEDETEYIVDNRLKDAMKVRAVYREVPVVNEYCHVEVQGGFFAEDYFSPKIPNGDILKGTNIYIFPNEGVIPEGKMLEHWLCSVDGGEFEIFNDDYVEVISDMVFKPVYIDIKPVIECYGEGGTVTDISGEYEVGEILSSTTTPYDGYTDFLGWYLVTLNESWYEEYELISTNETLTYETTAIPHTKIIARWSDGFITEEEYWDITVVNGFGCNNHEGIFVSSLRISNSYEVSQMPGILFKKNPNLPGIVSKWTITGINDDETELNEELYEFNEYGAMLSTWDLYNLPNEFTVTAVIEECTEHVWDDGIVTILPTHTTFGEMTFTCSICGVTKTEIIPKTTEHTYGPWQKHNADKHKRVCECGEIEYANHDWDNGVISTPATHLTEGVRTFTCSSCGETKTAIIPKTTEHSYGPWQKHNAAQHKRVCECGEIEYANHDWDNGVVSNPATHLTDGVRTFTCSSCGETKTATIPKTTEHTYGPWQKHNADQHKRVCECGDVEYANHDWNYGVIAKDATCTETGIMTYTCSDCGEIKTAIIEKSNHLFEREWSHDSDNHWHKCTNEQCDAISDLAPHNWGNGVITTPATHTSVGIRTFTCSDCGATRTETIPKITEHSYGPWQKHNADQHKRVCECGDIEYASHDWDNGVISTPATHISDGVRTFTCSSCGETKTAIIPKTTEHSYGPWQKHNADQHRRVCECGDVEYSNHDWDNGVITTPATHISDGVRTFTCSSCGETKTAIIPKTTEHTFGSWEKHNDDQHKRVCECGEAEYEDHIWDNGRPAGDGNGIVFTCSVCDAKKTVVCENHQFSDWEITPTGHSRECSLCGKVESGIHDYTDSIDGSCIVCGYKKPGEIISETNTESNALSAGISANGNTNLGDLIFNENDRQRIESGEDVKISLQVLDISDTVSTDDKAKVQSVLGSNTIGLYLDINLFKQIGTDEKQKVVQTNGKISITITIPDNLISNTDADHVYKIIRVHEGNTEIIEGIFNSIAKTFTFETDLFSTYALIYKTADMDDNNDPGTSPQTGEKINILLCISLAILVLAGLAISTIYCRRRYI